MARFIYLSVSLSVFFCLFTSRTLNPAFPVSLCPHVSQHVDRHSHTITNQPTPICINLLSPSNPVILTCCSSLSPTFLWCQGKHVARVISVLRCRLHTHTQSQSASQPCVGFVFNFLPFLDVERLTSRNDAIRPEMIN